MPHDSLSQVRTPSMSAKYCSSVKLIQLQRRVHKDVMHSWVYGGKGEWWRQLHGLRLLLRDCKGVGACMPRCDGTQATGLPPPLEPHLSECDSVWVAISWPRE